MQEQPPKTLIIGARSFIGKHLFSAYQAVHPDTIGTTRRPKDIELDYLDLRRPNVPELKLAEKGHTQAMILAAESNVARCESRPHLSRAVNVTGTLGLVEQLVDANVFPIFISTDYVFDGTKGNYTEEDETKPQTLYGKQKLEMEREVLERTHGECLVIRLSKMYALEKGDGTLLDEMAASFHAGKPVRAATDQIFNPMYVGDLAPALQALQIKGARGIVHVCGDEAMPRYGMARALAKAMGAGESLVHKMSISDLRGPRRPKDCSMNNDKLRRYHQAPLMSMKQYIERVAANYR